MDTSNSQDSERVDAVVADYLHRIDDGEPVDRGQLLKAHHEVATELRNFFTSEDLLRRLLRRGRSRSTDNG